MELPDDGRCLRQLDDGAWLRLMQRDAMQTAPPAGRAIEPQLVQMLIDR